MICSHYLIVLSELKGDEQAEQLWLKKQKPLTCVPLAPEKGKQTRHCHTEQCPQRSLLLMALSVLCVCKREGGAVHLCLQLTFRYGWKRMWERAHMRVQHDKFSITQELPRFTRSSLNNPDEQRLTELEVCMVCILNLPVIIVTCANSKGTR